MNEPTTTTETTETTPMTAESIAAIIDGRINNFIHSNKTDIAKLKSEVLGFGETLKGFAPTKTEATTTETPDQKYQVLERTLKDFQTKYEASEAKGKQAQLDNAVGQALAGYNWANETARQTAYELFSAKAKEIGEDSSGNKQYAIGDVSLTDAVKTRMNELTGLLASKSIKGSGATQGHSTASLGIDDIKPGMSKEDRNTLASQLSRSLTS